MARLIDLRFLFVVVAILEFGYFIASMMPPRYVTPVTGWVLNADGHWIVKLMGIALLTRRVLLGSSGGHPTSALQRPWRSIRSQAPQSIG